MCERCDEIDLKIERFQRVKRAILDKQTLDALDSLITDLEVEKASLHPQSE